MGRKGKDHRNVKAIVVVVDNKKITLNLNSAERIEDEEELDKIFQKSIKQRPTKKKQNKKNKSTNPAIYNKSNVTNEDQNKLSFEENSLPEKQSFINEFQEFHEYNGFDEMNEIPEINIFDGDENYNEIRFDNETTDDLYFELNDYNDYNIFY